MTPDPIVEEVRKWRQQWSARFGHDLHAIAQDARQRDQQEGQIVVRRAPRRPKKSRVGP